MILAALAEDLYRVANGLHSGTLKMAQVFIKEALIRKDEVNLSVLKPHIKVLLEKLPETFQQENLQKKAEDSLMYSAILRNYVHSL